MNKKGSYGDLFYILMVVVVCAFFFVIGWVMFSKVNDEFQVKGLSTEGKEIMQTSTDRYVETFDGLFLTIFVTLYIAAVILAWNIDASPVFFFLSLVVFGVLVLLAAVFGNSFYIFSINENIATYANDFTIIPLVMNYFVQIFVVLGFGLAGVMYAKTR